jgi:serine/threonine protein kinase
LFQFFGGAWEKWYREFHLVMEPNKWDEFSGKQLKKTNTPPRTIRRFQHSIRLAEALVYLWASMVHRDLKPDNILWVKDRWKLSGFWHPSQMSWSRVSPRDSSKIKSSPDGYAPPEAFHDGEIPTGGFWSLELWLSIFG